MGQYVRRALHWCDMAEVLLAAGCQVRSGACPFMTRTAHDAGYICHAAFDWHFGTTRALPLSAALAWRASVHASLPQQCSPALFASLLSAAARGAAHPRAGAGAAAAGGRPARHCGAPRLGCRAVQVCGCESVCLGYWVGCNAGPAQGWPGVCMGRLAHSSCPVLAISAAGTHAESRPFPVQLPAAGGRGPALVGAAPR